jgi:hypothetical protein
MWKESMTEHQFSRALKAIEYLSFGAPSFQCEELPACYVRNASSTFTHGSKVTECIATWVSEGYAAGPFVKPPCKRFRVNPLIAVVQPGKVRPVLDVSSPNGSSFNSNVDEYETESIKMASAKKFSQKLLDCGHLAKFSKHDLVAAYKQVPCRTEDLRLQGFCWLGKFFVETRQVFGAKTSVCNYDILGETLKMLAIFEAGIPSHLVMRQVDDVPLVSPEPYNFCRKFSNSYKELCEHLEVELAPNCPNNDKAFENQVRGKVLGVMFDSSDLTWRLSESKMQKTAVCISGVLKSDTCTLKSWQTLMGRINDICQMNPFMKIFRHPLNAVLEGVLSDAPKDTILNISAQAKSELQVWSSYLSSRLIWLPIGRFDCQPPLVCKEFVSDAAGLAETADFRSKPGCGNVGFAENGTIIFANQFIWPEKFIVKACDDRGTRYGDKTTTLEIIGVIIPLLLVPEQFINQHVVVKVDCFGAIYGLVNRSCSGDAVASIFIRAIYLIAAFLGSYLHVEHLPRMSDWGAEVTDRLSRASSTTLHDRKLVNSFGDMKLPQCLLDWFEKPVTDWNLALELLWHVKRKCSAL